MLTDTSRSTAAIARLTTELVVIPRQVLWRLTPSRGWRVVCSISLPNDDSPARTSSSSLAFLDAEARLATLLLQLDAELSDTGYVVVSQSELAQRLGGSGTSDGCEDLDAPLRLVDHGQRPHRGVATGRVARI